jgi:iron complex outermembrane receptor protein
MQHCLDADMIRATSPRRGAATAVSAVLLLAARAAVAQGDDSEPVSLKKLSLAELMNVEVTLVSGRPERLTSTPSAIQVITGQDIHRAGATSLPEALRLAPNLQVSQINSYGWVVSARGFSALFSNKLLAMIDGRTIYTPLFGGVSWDVQNVVLEDVDRIEVVSGPGGTLWGANAVNGVINVVSKTARHTQGLYVSGASGSYLADWAVARYGGTIGDKLAFRVYALRSDRDATLNANGSASSNAWQLTQGGFRADYEASASDSLTVQGDFYEGTEDTLPAHSRLDGQNVLARWTRGISDDSDLSLQFFADRTWRDDVPSTFAMHLETYDFDLRHRFPVGERQSLRWGFGYRLMPNEVDASTVFVGLLPPRRNLQLASAFVQDEIILSPERWSLMIGTKLEHNDYSGFEVQPSVRVAWTPDDRQTIWAAVSRAIRAPSRLDSDYYIPTFPLPPTVPHVGGGPNFNSETLIAYEIGIRHQWSDNLRLSLATFYNVYDDVYSVEPTAGTQVYTIQNGLAGDSWGAELAGAWQPTSWWRLRGGFSYLHKSLWNRPGHNFTLFSAVGNDPQSQAVLQSMMDLPGHLQLDLTARHFGTLPDPHLPGYFALDARLAWHLGKLEISVAGQNLLRSERAEFGDQLIPRNVYGRIVWNF